MLIELFSYIKMCDLQPTSNYDNLFLKEVLNLLWVVSYFITNKNLHFEWVATYQHSKITMAGNVVPYDTVILHCTYTEGKVLLLWSSSNFTLEYLCE